MDCIIHTYTVHRSVVGYSVLYRISLNFDRRLIKMVPAILILVGSIHEPVTNNATFIASEDQIKSATFALRSPRVTTTGDWCITL